MPEYRSDDPNLSQELKDAMFEGHPLDSLSEDELAHYGILRKSGRYPWGSGGEWGSQGSNTKGQRAASFLEMVKHLESQGLTKAQVAAGLGFESTTQLRDNVMIANNARRRDDQLKAEKLRAKGMSATEIGKRFDPPKNESSVRQLLNPSVQERTQILENTVNILRAEVDKGDGWLDIGRGTEYYVGQGLSKERLRAAVAVLKDEGYKQIDVQVDTATKNKTTVKTLCPPGTTYKDVVTTKDKIKTLVDYTEDGGRTWRGRPMPPMPISSDRIAINYKDVGPDGRPHNNKSDRLDPNSGAAADGVIYVRPGVKDVSIGGTSYAQVRINVDGTHYLKGMAMYKDDLPDGVDLMFNTNKSKADKGDDKHAVMKDQDLEDKANPFGAVIRRQITEVDGNGKERLTSVMNLLSEEGTWDGWSRKLSSQVLSKQSPRTAEQQLNITYAKKKKELDEILALTNPTVREKLLDAFADSADADAVHLHAAGMPRSSYHVLLPFNSLKDNEVYAPNFNQGERVALIRYPHGGTFEIPVLTVNNNAREPIKAIGRDAKDAVGINAKVAERLSGADFDGDFVMVIPNDSGVIKSRPALRQLDGFDPQRFKLPDEAPKMSARTKGKQMGDVSNLITDMTIKGATNDEISRAVRHSMVVIDAEKHHLDWRRSAQEFGIAALKKQYQGVNEDGSLKGASTLISRSTSEQRVNKRRPSRVADGGPIDKATGELRFTETGEMRTVYKTLKSGEQRITKSPVQQVSTKMAETKDARTLISDNGGTVIEKVYADHANRMKALANQSRKALVNDTRAIEVSPTAKKIFKPEVDQLKADLHIALKNSPRERAAQVLQNTIVAQKKAARPDMPDAELKKVKSQALEEARARMGAKKDLVPISERQWEAIQAGAVTKSMLRQILDNADIDTIKEYATPKPDLLFGNSEAARARSLIDQGLTQAEVARVMGMSLTTLKKGLANG